MHPIETLSIARTRRHRHHRRRLKLLRIKTILLMVFLALLPGILEGILIVQYAHDHVVFTALWPWP